MKPSLDQVQQDLQRFLLGQLSADEVSHFVAVTPSLSSHQRLEIYHNAYRIRLRDALATAFERTHIYLGDSLFYECCATYIESHPSQHSNLRWYGAQFPTFLRTHLSAHPAVAELAAFEWALGLAFDAEDQTVLTMQDCRALPPEAWQSIGFTCQSAMQIVPMHGNSVAIWLALSEQLEPPKTEFQAEPSDWLIWRKQLQPHFRSLTSAETQALQELRSGLPFAQVCANAAEQNPDAMPQIASWLQTWVNDEILLASALA